MNNVYIISGVILIAVFLIFLFGDKNIKNLSKNSYSTTNLYNHRHHYHLGF